MGPSGPALHGQLFGETRPEEASWAVVADASGVYTSVCAEGTDGTLYKLSLP